MILYLPCLCVCLSHFLSSASFLYCFVVFHEWMGLLLCAGGCLFFEMLHTLLKWLSLPEFPQVFSTCRHCLSSCNVTFHNEDNMLVALSIFHLCTYFYTLMACRGCLNTYIMMLISGHPICLINWLVIYIYTLQLYYSYKLSITNIYYIPLIK